MSLYTNRISVRIYIHMGNMNLVQLSSVARKAIAIFVSVISLYMIAWILKPTAINMYNKAFPPKDPPTLAYGMLNPLTFDEKQITGEITRIALNTKNGRLPTDLPKKMNVFKLSKPGFSYEAGRSAQRHADKLGFTDDELITDLKQQVYEWKDKETGGILEIDLQTRELELVTGFSTRDYLFLAKSRDVKDIANEARSMLTSINRFYDSTYTREEGKVTLGKVDTGKLKIVDTPFEAEVARVDFNRKALDYPVISNDPYKSPISVLVTLNQSKIPVALKYPEISYHEWEIGTDLSATYPIIPVKDAWNAILDSKGVIASVIPVGSSYLNKHAPVPVEEVLINEIYLAYYDSIQYQEHLQPIYVFSGDYNVNNAPGGKIVFYFPAIPGDYIKSQDQ